MHILKWMRCEGKNLSEAEHIFDTFSRYSDCNFNLKLESSTANLKQPGLNAYFDIYEEHRSEVQDSSNASGVFGIDVETFPDQFPAGSTAFIKDILQPFDTLFTPSVGENRP